MPRNQFTFYRSYYEALKNLPQKDQTKVLMAVCAYALDDEPPTLSGVPLSVFTLIRPTLDTGRNKSLNRKNKTKSNKEQTKNKQESNEEQTCKEREGEKEVEGEVEGDTPSTTTLLTSGSGSLPHAAVFRAYMDRINPTPSPTSMELLGGYVEAMGQDVCLRAIDKAIDAGKPVWNYVHGILRRLEAQGVKCLADMEALDEKHRTTDKQARGAGGPVDGPGVSVDDMDRMIQAAKWAKTGGDSGE